MKTIVLSLIFLLSTNSFASTKEMGPYELECDYYWTSSDGSKDGDTYNTTLRYGDEYSSDIPLTGRINLYSNDGTYSFKVVGGDEGTQFLVVTNNNSKSAAAYFLKILSKRKAATAFNVILTNKEEDFSLGNYSGEAGIYCNIAPVSKRVSTWPLFKLERKMVP